MIVFRVYVNLPLGTVIFLVLEMFPFLNGCFAYRLLASFVVVKLYDMIWHINLSQQESSGDCWHPPHTTNNFWLGLRETMKTDQVRYGISIHTKSIQQYFKSIFHYRLVIRLNNLFPSLPREINPSKNGEELEQIHVAGNHSIRANNCAIVTACSQHTVRETVTGHSIS